MRYCNTEILRFAQDDGGAGARRDGAAWAGARRDGTAWAGARRDGTAWDGTAWDGTAWDGTAWDGARRAVILSEAKDLMAASRP